MINPHDRTTSSSAIGGSIYANLWIQRHSEHIEYTLRWPYAVSMLGQRRRRWPNVEKV